MGALSGALGRLQANRPLRELREIAKGVTKQLPEPFQVGDSQGTIRTMLPALRRISQASLAQREFKGVTWRPGPPGLSGLPHESLPVLLVQMNI